jgi:hypothetical protein
MWRWRSSPIHSASEGYHHQWAPSPADGRHVADVGQHSPSRGGNGPLLAAVSPNPIAFLKQDNALDAPNCC